MSKLRIPLFSLKAQGALGDSITFLRRRKQDIVEKTPIPKDAKSLAQLSWRHMYQKAVALWHALSPEEKQEWESLARRKHMTGFAWFISQALKPNPGLYLPLQGGTMSGDIDMEKHRILKLPAPTDSQEPTRKSELDTHTADASAHHEKTTRLQSKAKIETRDLATPAGDVEYTGYGFTPTTLICFANTDGNYRTSWGFCDSTLTELCIAEIAAAIYDPTPALIRMHTGALQRTRAIVKSFDADGFTLTWSKTGEPTGTCRMHFLALR